MNIIEKNLKDIKPYEKNPRKNDSAVDSVANSIKEFGFKVPIVIDRDNVIVCGHTRYKAAKKIGLKAVPCVVADDLTEEQIKAYRLADNKVSEKSEWDFDLLGEELNNIFDIDMGMFDFDLTAEDGEEEDANGDEPISTGTSFNYKEQYGVIVICKDEREQEKIYNSLMEEGYECRVVTT